MKSANMPPGAAAAENDMPAATFARGDLNKALISRREDGLAG